MFVDDSDDGKGTGGGGGGGGSWLSSSTTTTTDYARRFDLARDPMRVIRNGPTMAWVAR